MRKPKRYRFNPGTLSYELEKISPARYLGRWTMVFVLSFLLFAAFVWLMSKSGRDLPKTQFLRARYAEWQSRYEILERRLAACDASLSDMAKRDDEVYRTMFGLGEIPAYSRESGISGVNRYSALDEENQAYGKEARNVDRLLKKAVVQSRSYDEVETVTRRFADVALSIPSICPLSTTPGNFRYSSPFGYRTDPVYTARGERHAGIDLACSPCTPVFAPADGVVVMAQKYYGYGNLLEIDHGFGYRTRYGHLYDYNVRVGDRVQRGDCIAFTGNSGKSTGPHLHYEVLFRGTPVNPLGFLDMEMPVEDYLSVVRQPASRPNPNSKSKKK